MAVKLKERLEIQGAGGNNSTNNCLQGATDHRPAKGKTGIGRLMVKGAAPSPGRNSSQHPRRKRNRTINFSLPRGLAPPDSISAASFLIFNTEVIIDHFRHTTSNMGARH